MEKKFYMGKIRKPAALLTAVSLLTCAAGTGIYSSAEEVKVQGDVNSDGAFNSLDALLFRKWMLGFDDEDFSGIGAGDLNEDGIPDIRDFCVMKSRLLSPENTQTEKIRVTTVEELKTALENAKPGDEIIVAEGEYIYSGSTAKGFMYKAEADGTEENPVIIRSENPENPAVLSGFAADKNTVLAVTGDWWEVRDLKITGAQKGIIIDNSNHTKITGCEVFNTGSEGIHFRDNSSYGLVENCYVHDTGAVSPGYGEAVYIGSAKSTTGYGFDCHYNTVRGCRLGPGVTAEHVDVKEYTIGTVIEDCIFDGTGISGENSAKSFVNIKGNDCVLRNNEGYRNGNDRIQRAFEQNSVADGWGQNASVYGNRVWMDTNINALGKKMYFLNSWNCTCTVWDNFMAYDGELFSVDNEADRRNYYNCNMIEYGESSSEKDT